MAPDVSKHNDDLSRYIRATARIAAERQLLFVDLFAGARTGLTDNGMHIKAAAQPHVAFELARQLGVAVPTRDQLEPLRLAVLEKHRLWYDYWRPANWKLLYGDDARRQFTKGGESYIPFKEEWKRLLPLIDQGRTTCLADRAGRGATRATADPCRKSSTRDRNAEYSEGAGVVQDLPGSGGQSLCLRKGRSDFSSGDSMGYGGAGPTSRLRRPIRTSFRVILQNDKIIVLEDTDRDGTADRSTVFAEGLNIPTGLELGDGGVYVGQNSELLVSSRQRWRRKSRTIGASFSSGFGNGDSHQTINSFVWSPGGELYMGQGDGIESRVETPWGPSHLYQAGFYRFRPRRLRVASGLLDDFMGPGNPWGVEFDDWGQIFSIDGAGGVTYLSPGQIPTSHRRTNRHDRPAGWVLRHRLSGWQSTCPNRCAAIFIVGDYKANRVKRFSVQPDRAGFKLRVEGSPCFILAIATSDPSM